MQPEISPEIGIAYIILILIALIPSLLCVILFFKIWGMTNDVNKIKSLLEEWLELEHPLVEVEKKKDESSIQK